MNNSDSVLVEQDMSCWSIDLTPLMPVQQPMWSGSCQHGVRHLAASIEEGCLGLAPWQRPLVWSEQQQVALLDSVMRGIPCGDVLVWSPMTGGRSPGRALPDAPPLNPFAKLIVDGQQRITALWRAWTGALDHLRWDGQRWGETGYATPAQLMRPLIGGGPRHRKWRDALVNTRPTLELNKIAHDFDRSEAYEIGVRVIEGPVRSVVEAYRRMAKFGTPHSVADMEVMEAYLRFLT